MKLFWGIVFAAIVAGAGTKTSVVRAQEAGVQEGRFITIGGIDQWVTIRGADRENPVILFLHGGPGSSLSPFAEALFKDWEQHSRWFNGISQGRVRLLARPVKPSPPICHCRELWMTVLPYPSTLEAT